MTQAVRLLSAALVAAAALATIPTGTSAQAADLKVGDPAPDFTLPGTDGKTHTLSQMKGQWVVLAWFPKAFTAG
jgi:peroxiredoxin Q/BCP